MKREIREISFPTLWVLLGLALTVFMLVELKTLITPLVLAWFIAYALDPLLDKLEERGLPRVVGVGGLLFVVAVGLVAGLALLFPALSAQLEAGAKALPGQLIELRERLMPLFTEWFGSALPEDLWALMVESGEKFKDSLPGVASKGAQLVGKVVANLGDMVAGFIGLALIPVFAFYLLVDFNGLAERLVELVPLNGQERARRLVERSDEVLGAFIRGQLTVCGLLALVYSAGLFIVGIQMWLVVGLLAGALSIVPYLGTTVGVVTASVLAVLTFHDFAHLFMVWGVFVVGQLLEGFVFTPRIVGDKVGLHPMVVMVAIIAGGELFGFVGILLAVPAGAVMRVALAEGMDMYVNSAYYKG